MIEWQEQKRCFPLSERGGGILDRGNSRREPRALGGHFVQGGGKRRGLFPAKRRADSEGEGRDPEPRRGRERKRKKTDVIKNL